METTHALQQNGKLSSPGKSMSSINFTDLSTRLCEALRSTFTDLMAANPDQTFYTFAIWTDDSLQMLNAAANTEEGLTATVEHYNVEVDPKYDTRTTRSSMRWAYGDWKYFPVDDAEDYLSDVNAVLRNNFDADAPVFEEHIGPLWEALLDGFARLEKDGFFGTGKERSRYTILLVGDLPDELTDCWATVLNPTDVAERYINRDCEAPDQNVDG